MWSSTCLAVTSNATLAKNIFVPMPAVAHMPVSLNTASIRRTTISLAVLLYKSRYGVKSIKHSSIEYTCISSLLIYLRYIE